MSTLVLYKKFITRENRFSEKSLLEQRAIYCENNNLTSGSLAVNGCNITNTSSYIDITLSSDYDVSSLYEYSSLSVDNNGKKYFGFVDRIEPNNFNYKDESYSYYRIYFTVDWWSTIMWWSTDSEMNDIKINIDGEVIRAHVNDINIRREITLDYTTLIPEFEVSRNKKISIPLGSGKKFMYVYSTKPVPFEDSGSSSGNSTPKIVIGEKRIESALNLFIGTVRIGDTGFLEFITYKERSTGNYGATNIIGLEGCDIISDSSVVGIFISDYMPFETINVGGLPCYYFGEYDTLAPSDSTPFSEYIVPRPVATVYGNEAQSALALVLRDIPSTKLDIPYTNTKGGYNPIGDTYNYYINHIPKAAFPPYCFTYFSKGEEHVVIDTAHLNSYSDVEYVVCPYIGGYLLYIPTELSEGENAYHILSDNSLFQRTSTNDNFTKLSAMSDSLKFLGKAIGSVGSIGVGIANGNPLATAIGIGGLSGLAGEGVSSYSRNAKMLRDGETGTKVVQNSMSDFITPLCVVMSYPDEESDKALRENLALYGYNTYLRPNEILINHRREYFNYVKTKNAVVRLPEYNTEIRKQIEDMFNSGVWLWNNVENFGNYRVPNYQVGIL